VSTALEKAHNHKPAYRRLLVGFNHHVECRRVLDFAAHVAEVAEVDLAGVFVEEQELLELARLPFSTEILHSSRQLRALDSADVERDLRALADIMQNALRRVAEAARRQFSFRTVRGHLLRELIAQAGAGDLVLLRTACVPWWAATPTAPELSGPVVLLEPPAGANGSIARLAGEIARAMKQQLVTLHSYSGPQSLRNLQAGLIITSVSMFKSDEWNGEIQRFVDAAPCPVLIVPPGKPAASEQA